MAFTFAMLHEGLCYLFVQRERKFSGEIKSNAESKVLCNKRDIFRAEFRGFGTPQRAGGNGEE